MRVMGDQRTGIDRATAADIVLQKLIEDVSRDSAELLYAFTPPGTNQDELKAIFTPEWMQSAMKAILHAAVLPFCFTAYASGCYFGSLIARKFGQVLSLQLMPTVFNSSAKRFRILQ